MKYVLGNSSFSEQIDRSISRARRDTARNVTEHVAELLFFFGKNTIETIILL